jgi:hypothetical protein
LKVEIANLLNYNVTARGGKVTMTRDANERQGTGANRELARIAEWLSKILVGTALATLPQLAKVYGSRLFGILTHTIGLHLAQIVVSAGVIAAGFLGHWFKGRNQWWYGFVEVIFGSASGVVVGFTMFAGQPLLTQWVTLVGCAYVISRGLNNISDSKKKKALPLPSPLETA